MTLEIIIAIIVSLTLGALIGWLVGGRSGAGATARLDQLQSERDEARKDFESLREKLSVTENERTVALTRADEIEKGAAKQIELLNEAEKKLTATFEALAGKVLKGSNESFLELADAKFTPFKEILEKYQKQTRELEEKRERDMGGVNQALRTLTQTQGELQRETGKLVNALKSPQVRGRWGEIALRRTAELAGMTDHCDFEEQVSVNTESGRLRPDMIVKLPGGRDVIVDSKVSMIGYLEALEATDEETRKAALERHAQQVSAHVNNLASKQYWAQFDNAPEFVVLFMPNDSFLAAAAEKDPGLIESALAKKVIIATPATFIALLRAIAYGWRQEKLTENAQHISELGQELYDRMATLAEHFARLGDSIGKSVTTYNKAVSSFETRVFTQARKFKDLGVSDKKEIEESKQLDLTTREVNVRSLPSPDDYK